MLTKTLFVNKESGAKLVIINEEQTDYDIYADLVIHKRKIGEVLKEIDSMLRES